MKKKMDPAIWISQNNKNSRLYSSLMDGCDQCAYVLATSVRSREIFGKEREFFYFIYFFFLRSIFERIHNDHPSIVRGAQFRNLLFMCNPWLQRYSRWIITIGSSVLVARTLSCPNTVWCATTAPIATWTRHISGVRTAITGQSIARTSTSTWEESTKSCLCLNRIGCSCVERREEERDRRTTMDTLRRDRSFSGLWNNNPFDSASILPPVFLREIENFFLFHFLFLFFSFLFLYYRRIAWR